MSFKKDGQVYLCAEPARACELCGKVAETRPYGPNGEAVCFSCGMKNERAAERKFQEFIEGESDQETLH
jgi:hypothetical protein